MSLDIGEPPDTATVTTDATDDPERLYRLTAHIIARVADRFAFLRKFSRHMEGENKRAGLLSDLFAAVVELYRRNPQEFERVTRAYVGQVVEQNRARKAATPSPQPTQPGGIPHDQG